ncbi:class I SAM-dependent RNA methyltransferase [Aneurinibacillus sp. Ricciae_BoGa-3]|uniref:THUMP domain-containing class I SAM-dependent RNA methyltransferase n=1 Tax=Aneurinibacillus sp. Ricciae_BoGa-3 TaxID=3022697 RepID=UPI00234188F7|nr:class I SAM-dependent RNA methyltransferase [Aneurinibacillus sp. Ricciae_BoGa-3]WCK52752.1 class I SAM-dependent RNA methyltransferase [Aneurinibacillus sp. Ricciae_BoGa-3]
MQEIELIATSTFGLESVVAQEVKQLGYPNTTVENGKVMFKGDKLAICRANLWLRSADRVRLKIGEFKAVTFDELFEKTKALPWADWIPENAEFPVEGKSVKSTLFSVSDCQAIVKKAVVESLKQTYKKSWFDENGPLFKIEVALLKDVATLTIDTTGPGLHKRGYRRLISGAPLKETMAAAMIQLARWRPDIPLHDPFCGSGTIPIEAVLIGRNIAPGMNREFVAEVWPTIPKKLWQEARRETHDLADYGRPLDIIGTDIDGDMIAIARENAEEAMVEDAVSFKRLPVAALKSDKSYGTLVCNPPYGERLLERKEVEKLYQTMGEVFTNLDKWSYYILTSYEQFEQFFGKKADKNRKLYNGNIKSYFYQYYGPRPPKDRS